MMRYLRYLVLTLLILASFSLESFNGNYTGFSSVDYLLFTPLNQRLHNEIAGFESSAYIEGQVNQFMRYNGLNAVSIAIVKDEKLVYSKAYGYANVEDSIPASPSNLFRVASASKLITATTIMHLQEQGSLSLNGKVFGKGGYLEHLFPSDQIKDLRIEDITVKQLLQHTSGFSNRYGDPMFLPHLIAEKTGAQLPLKINNYMQFALERRLHFTPGTSYGYSNMGYLFLGAVIESVTGLSYENYVRNSILSPMGIFDMHIGKNFFEEKRDNEVVYYEDGGYSYILPYNSTDSLATKPYGGNDIELLGAAGGWIASAPEFARMMVFIDGFDSVTNFISSESIMAMFPTDEKPLGWMDIHADGSWFRSGNFAGTSIMIARRKDGIQWVFLTNTSNWKGNMLSSEIYRLMSRIITKTDKWPDRDLFHFYSDANSSTASKN